MTICIAAVCKSSGCVVVAADRMFTIAQPLNVEFEPHLSKIEEISLGCAGLAAGNSVFASEVLTRTRLKIRDGQNLSISSISEIVKEEYTHFRDQKIEETIIRATFGDDLVSFRSKGGFLPNYLQVQPGLYQQIVVQCAQFNLGLDFLVVGTDEKGAHIYAVSHPGSVFNLDKLGYGTIGSGAVHAVVSLSLGGQTPDEHLHQTMFSVYDAKRKAEVAPGVGKETEMAIVDSKGVWMFPERLLNKLQEAYDETSKKSSPDLRKVSEAYDEQRKNV